jgi:transcriptional regulator with XRE-family HTH domain
MAHIMAYKHKTRTEEETDYLEKVGAKIRHYRRIRNMSQLELSMAIGIYDPVTMVRYEGGKISMSIYRLHMIADALGVRVDDLIPEI